MYSGKMRNITMAHGRIWTIIIIFGLSCAVTGRYRCTAKDFIRMGNSCYYLSSEIVSWQEAHFRCRDRDAQLAVLATQYEDSTLRNYLERPEFAQLNRWIGGMWMDWEQKWIWAAQGNEIENLRGFATSSVQKLPQTDAWMCLYMDPRHRYRWSNENCIRQLHYICEAPLSKIEEEEDTTITTTSTSTTTVSYDTDVMYETGHDHDHEARDFDDMHEDENDAENDDVDDDEDDLDDLEDEE